MSNKTRIPFTIVLIILFTCIFIFYPVNNIYSYSEEYVGNPNIKVGFFDFDGYHNTDVNGSKSGYGYEYLQEIAKVTGWNYDYVGGSWNECLKLLEEGKIDVLTSAQKTPEREKFFYFSKLDMGSSYVLMTVRSDNNKYMRNDYENFNGITVGLMDGNSRNAQFKKFAEDKNFTYTCENTYPDQTSLESALQNGEVDAIVTSSLRKIDNEKIISKFNPSPFYAMTKRPTAPGGLDNGALLMNKIDEALEEILTRNPEFNSTLYNKYYEGNHGSSLVLTPEETDYINGKALIKVACVENQKPLSYTENGEHIGILPDIVTLITDMLGISAEFVMVQNTSIAFDMLRAGTADIILNAKSDYAWAEKNKIKITSQYRTMQYSAVTRKNDSGKIRNVATPNDYFILNSFIEKNYSSDNIQLYANVSESIRAVQKGMADITYVDSFLANEACSASRNKLNATVISTLSHGISIGLSIDADALLYTILDKCVVSLPRGEIDAIITKHTLLTTNEIDFVEFIYQNVFVAIFITFLIGFIIIGALVAFIAYKRRANNHIYKLAYVDSLTELWNMHKFTEDTQKILDQDNAQYAIISMDIKKFSSINDNYSRIVGDDVIRFCARTLNVILGEGNFSARVKADNFIILYKYDILQEINDIIEKITASLTNYVENTIELKLKFDFGVYVIKNSSLSIFDCADFAEFARKETKLSKNNIIFFDEHFEDNMKIQKDIEERMESSLVEREFAVYYQPKFNMDTAEIIGAEALVRWNSKTRGFLSPANFIPVFEKNGFITELDFFVLEEVCILLSSWIKTGKKTIPISVNQSRLHFQSKHYLERLQQLMDKYGIPKNLIELEITETAFIDIENILSTVKMLQNIGFRLSVDDFGSGYSSLNLINAVNLDVLKIDKGFLSESQSSLRTKTIISKVIEMAKELDMEVICEGVETTEQVEFLLSTGCFLAQGYFFARPMTEGDFIKTMHYDV